MSGYRIVQANDRQELEVAVDILIEQGYVPLGGVSVSSYTVKGDKFNHYEIDVFCQYAQALVIP